MVDPAVRPAGTDDVAQLLELEREARLRVADQRGGGRWLDEHPARGEAWADTVAHSFVLVGHIGDVVVGYLVLDVSDGRIARIDEVYVTPEAREVGFGDGLLAAAVARGREVGASLIEGESLPGDRETKNLFERAHITARLLTVSARIDPEAPSPDEPIVSDPSIAQDASR